MLSISANNVNDAYVLGLSLMANIGQPEASRNGPVLVAPLPVATTYKRPWERVLRYPWRDANPFFHLYESAWMLAGRNDVESLTRYVKRMVSFSDDGETFNAAYGWRWQRSHGGNQLREIVKKLKKNPSDRRVVLDIWSPENDLFGYAGKDAACNIAATFQSRDGIHLDMVVFCRSNDIVWGCYGANAVHFSCLLEYVALHSELRVGKYTQISVNWHAYRDIFEKQIGAQTDIDPWADTYPTHVPMVDPGFPMEDWGFEIFMITDNRGRLPEHARSRFKSRWIRDTIYPMIQAHDLYKDGELKKAYDLLETECEDHAWKIAAQEWLHRRMK